MKKQFDINKIPLEFKEDLEKAISILKDLGCKEIYIFGSLIEGNVNNDSDIDLAIKGISEKSYFFIWSKLYMALKHKVDLVNLDKGDRFSNFLQKEGLLSRVA
ncbi:nucleotidyltransferase family protein [Spirochaetota bacterium]